MHPTLHSIASVRHFTALLLGSLLFAPAHAALDPQAALDKQADVIAKTIADKINGDPATVKDQSAIERTIAAQATASGFTAGGAAGKLVHDKVWALVGPAWMTAQGLDPTSGSGKAVLAETAAVAPATTTATNATTAANASTAGAATASAPPNALTFLQSGSVNINNRAKLVTAEVFANYSKIGSLTNTVLGYRLSTSLPTPGATSANYATAQLLEHDGGLANFFISFPSPPEQYPSTEQGHLYDTDKRYFRKKDDSDALLVYLLNGVGIRGYSPNTNVGSGSNPTTLQAMGTAYLGLGVDGPSFNGKDRDGSISFETYASGNILNKSYLNSIYGTTVARSKFGNWTAALKLSISSYVISAFYSIPFDSDTRSFAKDVTGVSVSYNGKTTPAKATKQ